MLPGPCYGVWLAGRKQPEFRPANVVMNWIPEDGKDQEEDHKIFAEDQGRI